MEKALNPLLLLLPAKEVPFDGVKAEVELGVSAFALLFTFPMGKVLRSCSISVLACGFGMVRMRMMLTGPEGGVTND